MRFQRNQNLPRGHDQVARGSYLIISPIPDYVVETLIFAVDKHNNPLISIDRYQERGIDKRFYSAVDFSFKNRERTFAELFLKCNISSGEDIKIIKTRAYKDALMICNATPGWKDSTMRAGYSSSSEEEDD